MVGFLKPLRSSPYHKDYWPTQKVKEAHLLKHGFGIVEYIEILTHPDKELLWDMCIVTMIPRSALDCDLPFKNCKREEQINHSGRDDNGQPYDQSPRSISSSLLLSFISILWNSLASSGENTDNMVA